MTLTITQMLCPSDKYNIKCPYEMTPEYITIHNTANDASAASEISYMIHNNKEVSFHYAVDDTRAVQGIPLNRNAWHAGDGGSGTGNRKSIAIEICYSKSGGEKFIQAERNAAYLTASLLKERGWGIDRVKKHQDWSGKYCPHRTLDMGWERFLDMVQAELDSADRENATQKLSAHDENKYNTGQYVTFGTSYPSSCLPCGIAYATAGSGQGQITAIVSGQAKYQIDNGRCYCNDGDIRETYTPRKTLDVNAYYKVYAGGSWYPEVKNLEDYAGDGKNAIRGIAIKVDRGSVKYRVHIRNGSWYPYVMGYDIADGNHGYAGDCRNDIDAVEVSFTMPEGCTYKKAKYRVAPIAKEMEVTEI